MLGQKERDDEGLIHMLKMAEDNFSWEPKSTVMVDLKPRPVCDIMGSNPGEKQAMYAADGYQNRSSNVKIQNYIFHDDGIGLGKHYEEMIGEDPRNPMLLNAKELWSVLIPD